MPRKKKIKLNWLDTVEQGLATATENQKPLLVFFTGSDWCPWCVGLYEYCMNNQEFASYANDNLNLVMIDFPKKAELTPERKEYCKRIFDSYNLTGLPTVLLFNQQYQLLGTTGYHEGFDGAAFVKELQTMLPKTHRNDNNAYKHAYNF